MSLDAFLNFEAYSIGYDERDWEIQSGWSLYDADNELMTVYKNDGENVAKEIKEEKENIEQESSIIIKLSADQISGVTTSAKAASGELAPKKAPGKRKQQRDRKNSTIEELEAELELVEKQRTQLMKIENIVQRRLKCNANYAEAKRIRTCIASKKTAIHNDNLEAENKELRQANTDLLKDNESLHNENIRLKSEIEYLKGLSQPNNIGIEVQTSYLIRYASPPSPKKFEQLESIIQPKSELKI